MIKLSFIIPVYNVKQWISVCLDKIYGQGTDEKEFEVICVDDCSPDNSKSIIKSYQNEHGNLRLIEHTSNKKAGGARNTGLRNAKGEYVWFVDPDDFILDNAIGIVLDECYNNQLDVLCFNYLIKQNALEFEDSVFKSVSQVIDGITFLIRQFGKSIVPNLGYPCRAVYKRQIIVEHNISFFEGILYGEETTFMAEVVIKAKRVKCIPLSIYCYRQNEQSVSSNLTLHHRGDLIYQSIIVAGNIVYNLQIKAREQSNELANCITAGLPWFLNRLFIRLIRTTRIERNRFYLELKNNKSKTGLGTVDTLLPYMDKKNRFILTKQVSGRAVLEVLSVSYKVKVFFSTVVTRITSFIKRLV